MPKKKPTKTTDAPTFEQALERLEAIVHRLEDGQLGLDEALGQYEEGVGLLRRSYELLKKAERRIEILTAVDSEGGPTTEPFDDQATVAAGGPGRAGRAGESTAERLCGPDPASEPPPPKGETGVDSGDTLF